MPEKQELLKIVAERLNNLTRGQLKWINTLIDQFLTPHTFKRAPDSDIITQEILEDFGDALRDHHSFSTQAFTKDRFEYALETIMNENGIPAKRAETGNPGHDINIRGIPFSLKTQADKNIKATHIHISKFHELGKGNWGDNVEDLKGLRQQFFNHMKSYERILTLRMIEKPPPTWKYELVEIPKSLLLEAKDGEFEMMHASTQHPKPGYCRVYEKKLDLFGKEKMAKLKFALYFDGGGERKLQIKALDKSLCKVHAEWVFAPVKRTEKIVGLTESN